MWGTVIALAGQALGSAMSAYSNRKAARMRKSETERAVAANEQRLLEDPTKRADNAAALVALDRKLQRQNDVAEAKNKIVGGTPEAVAQQYEASANAYGNAVSAISAGNAANVKQAQDNIEKARHDNAIAGIEAENARQTSYANIISNAANNLSNMRDKPKADNGGVSRQELRQQANANKKALTLQDDGTYIDGYDRLYDNNGRRMR